ncbi:MAG TPA: endonuclease/exonuclease/phosphatase family protein [Planctomycetota bacterium]|nr:endonuclease/exonuclease/phosphatase family protein [Planctomycetota bacterium]
MPVARLLLVARVAAAALVAWIALGQLAAWCWPGELAVSWSAHAAVVLLAPMILLRDTRRWRALCALAFAAGLWPSLMAAYERRAPPVGAGATLTIAHGNLLYSNRRRDEAIDALVAERPDVLLLCEAVTADRARLEHDPRWPHQRWLIGDLCGNAVLSRFPITSAAEHVWSEKPAIAVVLDVGGRALRLISAHPRSPSWPSHVRLRDEYLVTLGEVARASGEPLVVIGDLNVTVASPAWRAFRSASGLRRPLRTPPTWPSHLGPLGIAIDHVLVGDGLAIDPPRALRLPGSDHRGVVARVAFAR